MGRKKRITESDLKKIKWLRLVRAHLIQKEKDIMAAAGVSKSAVSQALKKLAESK